ncbi:putative bifunctional diguanylate cyclase/phosphodiesterase [Catenovulum sediminis]|uniref:EAL domain-containing protein n=1 Tax=Catenovulum sediminis TaxID=1740262 RepID=A0ABV1RKL8_9ALTE
MFVSIRTKLLVMTFGALIVTSIAIVVIALKEHTRVYNETVKSDFTALAENIAEDLVEYYTSIPIDEFAISTRLLQLDKYPYVKFALVTAPANNEVVESFINPEYYSTALQKEMENVLKQSADKVEGSLLISKQIGDPRLPLGQLYLTIDTHKQLSASQTALFRQLVPLVIITSFAIMALAHWLQTNTITPLLQLSRLVEAVRKTKDYSLRNSLKPSHHQDEVSFLSNSLNEMLATISQQQDQNKKHTQELIENQRKLVRLANYDPLTNLPNRKLFMDMLQQYINRQGQAFAHIAILIMDVDDFKTINDAIGHAHGDTLLIKITQLFKEILSDNQVLARIGGDEFAVIIPDDRNKSIATQVCEAIFKSLERNIDVNGWSIQTSVSIGVAYYKGQSTSIQNLVSNADIAMYKAKSSGRNRYVEFIDAMTMQQNRRLQIASSIKQALDNNEFYLLFQPKVAPTKGVVGVEALIRWNSQQLGIISPAEFIPIAEQTGRINDITRWVIKHGFKKLHHLQKSQNNKLKVSFNLSTFDIFKPEFLKYLKEQLAENQLEPQYIEFEITESSYIENFSVARNFINSMQEVGCSIALDDFGTGYSSLSYLTQINAETIKIDQYFVRNLFKSEKDKKVADAIISLSLKLNMTICAEGVENQKQYEYLKAAGCHQIQGYYFSKPVAYEQLNDNIKRIQNMPDIKVTKLSSVKI